MNKSSILCEYIGKELRAAREFMGYTMRGVAAKIDISPVTIIAYERGSAGIKMSKLIALCELYRIDFDKMMSCAWTLAAAPGKIKKSA